MCNDQIKIRLLAALLVFCIIIAYMPLFAYAAEGDEADQLQQETEEVDYRKLYEEKCQEVNSLLKELSKTKEENDRLSSQARELKQVITAVRTQVSSLKNL